MDHEISYEELVRTGKYIENPEIENNMVESLFSRWKKYNYLLEPKQETIYSLIAERIDNQIVCDMGCGAGVGSVMLKRKAVEIIAIDKSKNNIEFAKKIFPVRGITFIQGDVTDLSGTFVLKYDSIVCVETIEHIANYKNALEHLKRRLNKEGVLYISSPNRNNKELGDRIPSNESHVREWALEEFRYILLDYFNEIKFYDFKFYPALQDDTPIVAECRNV